MAATCATTESAVEIIKKDPSVTKVSVIKDIGDFAQVITIRTEEFTLKIQIPRASADDLKPCLSLQSSRLSGETANSVGTKLQAYASDHRSDPNWLVDLFSLAKSDICDIPINSEAGNLSKPSKKPLPKKTKQQGKQKAAANVSSQVKTSKKPSMKTAEDVVKRVLWDESISQEDITIGYIDRFKGLQEKPFMAFSWEDLASIDYFTFAIPKHRIQYFKYKREVIWDKSLRLDNVFGSAGSQRTIQEVIAEYKDEDHQNEPAVPSDIAPPTSNVAPSAAESAALLAHLNLKDNFDAYGPSDSDDDSSDDGVVVTVDNCDDKVSEIYSQSEGEDEGDEAMGHHRTGAFGPAEYWMDKVRPNFFLCVRVTSPEILAAVERVQKTVVEREPRYTSCCVPPCMLHVTLCTLRLNNAEEASQCLEALRKYSSEIRQLLPSEPLRMEGLDRFFHRVLYTHARHGPEFLSFVEHVCTILRSEGIRLMDHHDFVPHMTVMKVSRPVSREMGTKYIAPYVFAGLEETSFGEQAIDSIYLCSMEKERGPDGFYLTPGSLTFMREVL